jgi:hypothetical protein
MLAAGFARARRAPWPGPARLAKLQPYEAKETPLSNLVLRATAGCRRDDGTSLAPCWTAPTFLLFAAELLRRHG